VNEEDPQSGNSSSSDMLDPPQDHLLPIGWIVPTWESVVAHHMHAHHLPNHIQSSDMNHDINRWTHYL
jgi:hypothetical protein